MTAQPPTDQTDEAPRWRSDPDPVWLNTRREAWWIFALWAICLTWTIGACHFLAYRPGVPSVALGMPAWVVVGVLVPWVLAGAASLIFSLRFIKDDELE